MLTIEGHTKLTPKQTVEKAAKFFGGYGMSVKGETDNDILLDGAGGGVGIFVCADDKGSTIQATSREWDSQVKDFLEQIHG
jgi:hypothetical protein